MTNESSANAIIGNTLRIIASGEYHPGAELTQKMASYIIELEQKLTDMAVQFANAESKCEALSAENAAMKDWSPNPHSASMFEAIEKAEALMDDGMPELAMIEAFEILKMKRTPATDAFLAEVRAQGVDASIEHLSKKFEDTGYIGVPVMALEWLAQEIRKGAAL